MAAELHLPDLPQVQIAMRAQMVQQAWRMRLRDGLSTYLPLLLMVVLALGTWWLVKNTPVPAAPPANQAPRTEPDYSMHNFVLARYAADGRLKLRMQGESLTHYPDTDRVEVLGAHITSYAPDGRTTTATAQKVLGNGDGSELQLLGNAHVQGQDPQGQPFVVRGEFLHLFLVAQRMHSHKPVVVEQGGSRLEAGGLDYDHAAQRLELAGQVKAKLGPRAARP